MVEAGGKSSGVNSLTVASSGRERRQGGVRVGASALGVVPTAGLAFSPGEAGGSVCPGTGVLSVCRAIGVPSCVRGDSSLAWPQPATASRPADNIDQAKLLATLRTPSFLKKKKESAA